MRKMRDQGKTAIVMTFFSSFIWTSSFAGSEADYCIIVINRLTGFLFSARYMHKVEHVWTNTLNKLLLLLPFFALKSPNRIGIQRKKLTSSCSWFANIRLFLSHVSNKFIRSYFVFVALISNRFAVRLECSMRGTINMYILRRHKFRHCNVCVSMKFRIHGSCDIEHAHTRILAVGEFR